MELAVVAELAGVIPPTARSGYSTAKSTETRGSTPEPPDADDGSPKFLAAFRVLGQSIVGPQEGQTKTIELTQNDGYEKIRKRVVKLFEIDENTRVEVIGRHPRAWETLKGVLHFNKYLHDERIQGYGPRMVITDSQEKYTEAIAGQPLSREEQYARLVNFLKAKMEDKGKYSAELQQEGALGCWELSCQRNFHGSFTDEVSASLVRRLELRGGVEKLFRASASAVWGLAVTSRLRRAFLSLGALDRLLVVLKANLGHGVGLTRRLAPEVRTALQQLCVGCIGMLTCDNDGREYLYQQVKNAKPGVPDGLHILAQVAHGKDTFAGADLSPGEYPILPKSIQEVAAEVICMALHNSEALRGIFGRIRGLATLVPLLDSASEQVQWAASAALCAFARTGEGRSLLANCPGVPSMFQGLSQMLLSCVREYVALPSGEGSMPRGERGEELIVVIDRTAYALWGCAKALVVPVGGLAGLAAGIVGPGLNLESISTFIQAVMTSTQAAELSCATYCLGTAIGVLATSSSLCCALLACQLAPCLGTLAAHPSLPVREAALGNVGLVLQHTQVDRAQMKDPEWLNVYLTHQYPHRFHLLSAGLSGAILRIQRDAGRAEVDEAAAVALMHFATVGGVRSTEEVQLLVDLAASERASTALPAAAALWALAREAPNRATAEKVGAVEALLVGCARFGTSAAVADQRAEPDVRAVEFMLGALWLLIQDESTWALEAPLEDDQGARSPSTAGPRARLAPAWQGGGAEEKGEVGEQDEEAFWEEQRRKYAENEGKLDFEATQDGEDVVRDVYGAIVPSSSKPQEASAPGTARGGSGSRQGARGEAPEEAASEAGPPEEAAEAAEGAGPAEGAPADGEAASQASARGALTIQKAGIKEVGILVELIGLQRLESDARDGVKQLAVSVLHALVARPLELGGYLYENAAVDCGVGHMLLLAARDPAATSGLRNAAARFYHVLSMREEHAHLLGGGGGLHEEVLVSLLCSEDEALFERGARGCGTLAMTKEGKARLASAGAIEALVRLVARAGTQLKDHTLAFALQALLNVSSTTDFQVTICKLGLDALLAVCADPYSPEECRELARGTLGNIASHPHNRTRMFTAELRKKVKHLARRPPRRPPPRATPSPQPLDISDIPSASFSTALRQDMPSPQASMSSFTTPIAARASALRSPAPTPADGGASSSTKFPPISSTGGRKSSAGHPAPIEAPSSSWHARTIRNPLDQIPETPAPATMGATDPGTVGGSGEDPKDRFLNWLDSSFREERSPSPKAAGRRSKSPPSPRARRSASPRAQGPSPPPGPEEKEKGRAAEASASSKAERSAGKGGGSAARTPHPLVTHMNVNWGGPDPKVIRFLAQPKTVAAETGSRHPGPPREEREQYEDTKSIPTLKSSLCRPLANIWDGGPGKLASVTKEQRQERHWTPKLLGAAPDGGIDLPPSLPGRLDNSERPFFRTPSPDPAEPLHITLQLEPQCPRNCIHFDDEYVFRFSMEKKHHAIFEHVEGTCFCRDLYKHYTLPDGSQAHIYIPRKQLVDEEDVMPEAPAEPPHRLADILQPAMPEGTPMLQALLQMTVATVKSSAAVPRVPGEERRMSLVLYRPRPALAPEPHTATTQGLIGVPLDFALEVQTQVEVDTGMGEGKVKEPWDILKSVFALRRKESDSRSLLDTGSVVERMFEKDWQRCNQKERFVNTILKRHNEQTPEQGLQVVRDVLRKHYVTINAVHRFYSSFGSGDIASMQLNEWTEFLNSCKISDARSKFCKLKDCDVIFITTDFETDKLGPSGAKLTPMADAKSLQRFEFLESIVRLAIAKYAKEVTRMTTEAINMLMEKNISANLPWEVLVDRNDFRQHRLYTEEMDNLFSANLPFLKALYKYYTVSSKSGSGSRKDAGNSTTMGLDGWSTMLHDSCIMDDEFTKREAKLCFMWAKMEVVEELKQKSRLSEITFTEFLEAFARMADMVSPCTKEELEEFMGYAPGTSERVTYEFYKKKSKAMLSTVREIHWPRRASGYKHQSKKQNFPTRSLPEKTAQMLEVVAGMLTDKNGVNSTTALTKWLALNMYDRPMYFEP